jgi:hypothetical protein
MVGFGGIRLETVRNPTKKPALRIRKPFCHLDSDEIIQDTIGFCRLAGFYEIRSDSMSDSSTSVF